MGLKWLEEKIGNLITANEQRVAAGRKIALDLAAGIVFCGVWIVVPFVCITQVWKAIQLRMARNKARAEWLEAQRRGLSPSK